MMPVAPTAKRSNGFSIDSLMGKDPPRPRTPTSRSPGKTSPSERASVPERESREPTIGGAGSSFHPVHPGAGALLNGLKGLYQHAHAHAHGQRIDGGHPHLPEGLPPMGLTLPFTGPPGGPPGLALPGMHHHPGLPHHPLFLGAQRDPFSLYPWLLSRQGSVFGHPRLAGPEAGLLYQPFRKPKRIRTAFSPSQLLRLEHAFEKNHYVVGQERKDLAANLSLTETQVKVWFQNRRTKYKRMKAEEAESGGEPRSDKDPEGNESHDSDIDMGDIEGSPCGSPKLDSLNNGHSSEEEDDIEIEASDTEDELLHHQSIMAAQFRLYQSAAAEVVHPEDRPGIVGSPPSSSLVQTQPPPHPEVNWVKESPKV